VKTDRERERERERDNRYVGVGLESDNEGRRSLLLLFRDRAACRCFAQCGSCVVVCFQCRSVFPPAAAAGVDVLTAMLTGGRERKRSAMMSDDDACLMRWLH
jgi:hypothetical protein